MILYVQSSLSFSDIDGFLAINLLKLQRQIASRNLGYTVQFFLYFFSLDAMVKDLFFLGSLILFLRRDHYYWSTLLTSSRKVQ